METLWSHDACPLYVYSAAWTAPQRSCCWHHTYAPGATCKSCTAGGSTAPERDYRSELYGITLIIVQVQCPAAEKHSMAILPRSTTWLQSSGSC